MNHIGIREIAADLGLSQRYVSRTIVNRPDFPPPAIRLNAKTRRWAADDYRAWKATHSTKKGTAT